MRLSIITINYNNLQGLCRTAESIKNQFFRDFEWIVIDGGSTDGSKDFIIECASNPVFNLSYWCSEKDNGIYNAMNKGIDQAKGEYLNFMNSGDWFSSYTVLDALFSRNPKAEIVSGNVLYMYDVPQRYMQCRSLGKAELSGWDFFYTTLPHQGAFFKKQLFENGLRYDETYKILSDLNLFLNMYFLKGASIKHYNDLDIACFDVTGVSQTEFNLKNEERARINKFFLSEEEFLFYKNTLPLINIDLRHNIKNFRILFGLLYCVTKLIKKNKVSSISFEKPLLSSDIQQKDIDFFRKSETIRSFRMLWKVLNYVVDTSCRK